jgi:hypothetical protein
MGFDPEFQLPVVEVVAYDAENNTVNRITTEQMSTNESVILLRRLVKLLESQAVTDPRFRQIVTLGAIKASEASAPTELAGTMPVSGSIGTSVVTNPNSAAPPYTTAATVTHPVFETPVDQRWRVAEDSHISYQLGIRNHLTFS